LVSYTQYYANLTKIQEQIAKDKRSKHHPEKHFKYKVEYTTSDDKYYKMKDLTVRSYLDLAERIGRDTLKMKDIEEDPEVSEDMEYESASKGKGHTKKKTKTAKNHLWKEFVKRAFVHTKLDEEIDQDFG